MTSSREEVATLTRWAAGLDRAEQDRLLLSLSNLLHAARIGARSRELFDHVLPTLAQGSEPDARAELVRRLEDAPWAPEALLTSLAADADESTALLLARRRGLPQAAAAALLQRDSADLQLALATNRAAELGPDDLDQLVETSRRSAVLRAPLARRHDLSREQAVRLASWSSPPLRRALAGRFGLEDAAPADPAPETARRVVEKLGRSGRLTPGYALSALRRGRLAVFQEAIATLGDVPTEALSTASQADDPAPLALACAAAGLDRAVFPEVLREVRAANGGLPADKPDAAPAVIAALARRPSEAAAAMRADFSRRGARWGPA